MSFVYNRNHNRSHTPGCRAIGMMNYNKNAEVVEEPQGHGCGLCGCSGGPRIYNPRDAYQGLDPYIGEKICHDHQIRATLKKFGCACGSHKGDVRMYPHEEGYQVQGEAGKWWVYFHCYNCGHDTSLSKVPPVMVRDAAGVEV